MIDFSEMGNRLRKWENFCLKYPNFILRKESKSNYEMYLSLFLQGGGDDTFCFEITFLNGVQWFGEMLPEERKAYENYNKLNLDTPSGRIVREFYNLVRKNHFKYGNNITEFYKRNHIEPLVESWKGKDDASTQ